MATANLFGRAALPAFGGHSFATIEWRAPAGVVGDRSAQRLRSTVERAEAAYKEGNAASCRDLLRRQAPRLDVYGRRLLTNAATQVQDWEFLTTFLAPPRNVGELVSLFNAYCTRREFDRGRQALDNYGSTLGLDHATESALRARLSAEEKMHG